MNPVNARPSPPRLSPANAGLRRPFSAGAQRFRPLFFAGLTWLALGGRPPSTAAAESSPAESPPAARDLPASAPADEIILGVTLPLSGRFQSYGQSALTGVQARVREQNAAGGVNGRQVRLVSRDNQSEADKATSDINILSRNLHRPAVAIIGPLLAEALAAAHEIVGSREDQQKVVVVSPLANLKFVRSDDPPWVFTLGLDSMLQARALARCTVEDFGAATAAVLVDARYEASWEMALDFRRAFADEGGTITTVAVFKTENISMHSPPADSEIHDWPAPVPLADAIDLLAREERPPDLIYIPCYAEDIISIVRDIGKRPTLAYTRLCGPDLWDNQLVFDGAGKRVLDACFTSVVPELSLNYPPFQHFVALMREAGMNMPDAQAICAYDATSLLLNAMAAGDGSPEAIRDELLRIRRFPLATGSTSIAPNGSAIKPIMLRIMEVQDGWPTPVYTLPPTEFRFPAHPPAPSTPSASSTPSTGSPSVSPEPPDASAPRPDGKTDSASP